MSTRHLMTSLAAIVALVGAPVTALAQDTTVTVGNGSFTFAPSEVEVTAGSTITWQQTDALPHSVTASDGSFDSHPNCNSDGSGDCMGAGDTYPREFTTPGTFAYYCKVHGTSDGGGMAGTITVTAAEDDPTEAPPTEPPATEPPTDDPTEAATTPAPATTATAAPTAAATPSLPETGADRPWALVALGAGLVAGGALALRASRRRPEIE